MGSLDSVHIIRADREARLIFDDMRCEILRLLAKEPLTSGKLATALGLAAPTVSHHLDCLKRAGMVAIVKTEEESHGILQKFYRAKAYAYVIDSEKLSASVKRYLMPAKVERTRGVLAALSLGEGGFYKPSSWTVEKGTKELAKYVLEAAERRQGPCAESDPECVIHEIYREAISNLVRLSPEIIMQPS